jgi:tripartite-type tricarboxylate transporter receptor subunit TctC
MKKKKLFPQIVCLSFILVFLFLLPLHSFSQDFPSKPITLYIGYEPGAGTDITGRVLAREAERILGVPVVPENKPGGGSAIAAALLAKKKPDGYTLAVVATTAMLGGHIMMPKATFQPFKDFTYIVAYGTYNAGGVCVPIDSPWKTLPEFIEHARKNPGLSYSSSGIGPPYHLAMEYMAKQARVTFRHVPFKGTNPAMTALLGRHVDFIAGTGSHLIYVRQGIWRMLAVMMGADRDPNFPDVPTFKEFGYEFPVAPSRLIVIAPRDLPEPIYNKLESVFRQAAHSPEVRKSLEKLDMGVAFADGRQLEVALKKDYKFYSEFIQELGLLKK